MAEPECRGTFRNLRTEPVKTLGSWARCKDLQRRWNNPMHLYVLRGDCVSTCPNEKEPMCWWMLCWAWAKNTRPSEQEKQRGRAVLGMLWLADEGWWLSSTVQWWGFTWSTVSIFCHPCLVQEWLRETGDSPAERDAEIDGQGRGACRLQGEVEGVLLV